MIHNDYQSILGAQNVSGAYLRAISVANGSYTMTTAGAYNTKPFRTFLSNGLLKVTELKAKSLTNPDVSEVVVTSRVIDSTTANLPSGVVYTLGDEWIFTSVTTSAGVITLNF